MFYHLKIILRNLRRGGIYSVINVGGLAIGMAAAILILTWIHHEWSYDRFHAKEKNLYVAHSLATYDGRILYRERTPMILGPTLKADYPEIAGIARMSMIDFLYAHGDEKFKIWTGCTDSDFLTMFDFPLLQGNIETALNDPYSVILTEKAAIRLFGREDPMGQTILLNREHSMTVTGVMKDLPGNTLFRDFDALVPMLYLQRAYAPDVFSDNWRSDRIHTYVELHPNARLSSVNESVRGIIQAHTNDESPNEVFLYPLSKQHLYSQFVNGIPTGGKLLEKMRLYGVIAGLILLIACINFTNLSTARSEKRAKEVGVRKVMGGKRLSLIKLFLSESIMVSFIAGIIALYLAVLALPVFSRLMERPLSIDLTNGWVWLAGLGFVLFTGLLAGSYPAFFLSSFMPVKVLKGLFKTKQALVKPRKVLVVVQFTVACALMASTFVIHRQIRYSQNRETGYDKEQLIYMSLEGDIGTNYELIRHDLLTSGTALSVSRTSSPMTEGWYQTDDVDWQGKATDATITFDLFFTDANWTKTVGVTLIEGRDIDVFTYLTDSAAMFLNESAVRAMNLEHPVGEVVRIEGRDWHITGVAKDFILDSPYHPVTPMLICGPSGWFSHLHIKLNNANRMADNLAKTREIFNQYNPAFPFDYRFVDEEYARKFQDEKKLGSLASWFAGLTILISCMGLFALVAYMAETRRKEIGIRKVLGASVSDVIVLLSKEFLMLVLISVVVASPIAWWIMNQWLTGYAYRTNIPWWLFVVVGCISLGIALLTVGFQAIKAATANPVKSITSYE